MFDFSTIDVDAAGGIITGIGAIIGSIGSLFGGGSDTPSMPAAPTAPDTTAVDQKAAADEERKRKIAAAQNATNQTGGSGLGNPAATQGNKLG